MTAPARIANSDDADLPATCVGGKWGSRPAHSVRARRQILRDNGAAAGLFDNADVRRDGQETPQGARYRRAPRDRNGDAAYSIADSCMLVPMSLAMLLIQPR